MIYRSLAQDQKVRYLWYIIYIYIYIYTYVYVCVCVCVYVDDSITQLPQYYVVYGSVTLVIIATFI